MKSKLACKQSIGTAVAEKRSNGADRFEYVDAELCLAMTFITVANLAFHFGDDERGIQAVRQAEDARFEASRSAASFSRTDREAILSRTEQLDILLTETSQNRQNFGIFIQQPSMS